MKLPPFFKKHWHKPKGFFIGFRAIIFCFIFSWAITIVSYYINHFPYSIGESKINHWIESFKKNFGNSHYQCMQYIKDNILFIDISGNYVAGVADVESNHNEFTDINTYKIINRQKLSKLFEILNTNSSLYSFAICDLFFQNHSSFKNNTNTDTTDYDKTLNEYARKLQISNKIIFPSKKTNPCGDKVKSIVDTFNEDVGDASYNPVSNFFVQSFMLNDADEYSIEFLMNNRNNKAEIIHSPNKFDFLKYFGIREIAVNQDTIKAWNSFVTPMTITSDDINTLRRFNERDVVDNTINIINLKTIFNDTSILSDILKPEKTHKKMIFIANFTDKDIDIHRTIWGDIPGNLIILNAYLHMKDFKNKLNYKITLALFLSYFSLFYLMIYKYKVRDEKTKTKANETHKNQSVTLKGSIVITKLFLIPVFTIADAIIHYWYYIVLFFIWVYIYIAFDFYLRIIALSIFILLVAEFIKKYYSFNNWLNKIIIKEPDPKTL